MYPIADLAAATALLKRRWFNECYDLSLPIPNSSFIGIEFFPDSSWRDIESILGGPISYDPDLNEGGDWELAGGGSEFTLKLTALNGEVSTAKLSFLAGGTQMDLTFDNGKAKRYYAGPSSLDGVGSLEGTWEIVGSKPGGVEVHGAMELAAHLVKFQLGDATLTAHPDDGLTEMTWEYGGKTSTLTSFRDIIQPLDAGIIPVDMGGLWHFDSSSGSCIPQLLDGNFFHGTCTGASKMPPPLPSFNGTFQGKKTQPGYSVLGDLGGYWDFDNSKSTKCRGVAIGNFLGASCANAGTATGSVYVSFGAGVASGKASGGVEFTAVRKCPGG